MLLAYSDKPLRLAARVGFAIAILSLIAAVFFAGRFVLPGSPVQGFTTLAVMVAVHLIEPSPVAALRAEERQLTSVLVGRLEDYLEVLHDFDLPDLVTAFDVIEHFEDDLDFVRLLASSVNLDLLTYASTEGSVRDVLDDERYSFVRGDVADVDLVRSVLQDRRIDVVIHAAAESHVDRSIAPTVLLNGLKGETIPIYGDGQNVRDWIHVDDHVSALIALAVDGVDGRSYNIGAGVELSNLSIANAICKLLDGYRHAPRGHESHCDLIEHVADRPGHDFRYALRYDKDFK